MKKLNIEEVTEIFDDCFKTMQAINSKIDGIAFIKNRNPIINNQMLAKVQFKSGKGFVNADQVGEELYYSDFPKWKGFIENDQVIEDEGKIKISTDVLLESEKSQLIKSLNSDKYQWGIIVVFGKRSIKWTARIKEILRHLSHLISKVFMMNHNYEKERFQDQKGKLIAKENVINLLKAKIDEQDEKIASLEKSYTAYEGSVRWKSEGEEFSEIWVSMQGYKDGDKDPSASHWKRIDSPAKIDELEAILKDETQLMLA